MRPLVIVCLTLATLVACSDNEQITSVRSRTAADGGLAFTLDDPGGCLSAVEAAATSADGFKSAVKNVKAVIGDDTQREAAVAQAGAALDVVIGRYEQVQAKCAGEGGPVGPPDFDPLNATWTIEPPLSATCDARWGLVPITLRAELAGFVLSTSGADPVLLNVQAKFPWALSISGLGPFDQAPFLLDDALALPDLPPDFDPRDLVGRAFQGGWSIPPANVQTPLGTFSYQGFIGYDIRIVSLTEIAGRISVTVTATGQPVSTTCALTATFTAMAET